MKQKNLKIIDLTGAGDLFAAGFLHGYVNNLSLKESLEKGTEFLLKLFNKLEQDYNLLSNFKLLFFLFLLKLPFPFLGLTTLDRYFGVIKSLANLFLFFQIVYPFFFHS